MPKICKLYKNLKYFAINLNINKLIKENKVKKWKITLNTHENVFDDNVGIFQVS